jgi:hypothetical protein
LNHAVSKELISRNQEEFPQGSKTKISIKKTHELDFLKTGCRDSETNGKMVKETVYTATLRSPVIPTRWAQIL